MLKTLKTGFIAAVAAIALAPLGADAQQQKSFSIATGGTGGVYYPMGGGLANVLSKNVPGWQATAEVTAGSVSNLQFLGAKKAEIAFVMVDAALDAMRGEDKFKDNVVPVRTLMVLYPNRMHVVSTEAMGVKTMKDIKGKRVSTGSPGSATEVMAFRVIEAAGLDKDKDMKRERLGVAESVNAIKDRKIDAFFWVGGLPTAAVSDLGATPGVKIQMIDHADVVPAMNKKYGNLYVPDTIAKTVYGGMAKDNQVATVWNILVVHKDMSDADAYTIVKTIFERKTDMVAVHKEAENFDHKNQTNARAGVPFHPGALKYFAEKGVKLD
ncbi:MAG: TAXI family TRAP transporter solute-binding subunit [Rhodospirillales bacterium]|nr:TAXI family TRAP transporter solute-binding subunit [Rhodospirillales bacterium]